MARQHSSLDCVVLGYNEPPFEHYESILRRYGEDSEAYRDLRFSFVEVGGEKLTYVDLMNHVYRAAGGGGDLELRSGDIPCLAAAYLVNFLRRQGLTADYINLFQPEKGRLLELLGAGPRCIAITTTLYVVNFPVNEIVEFIREHDRQVKIVVGGPLVANHARNYRGEALAAALHDIGADFYVVEGQGELTLTRLVECLKHGGDPGRVPNLMFFDGKDLRLTSRVPENNSLDDNAVDWLSLSARDLGRTLQTRTARSCAFNCSFCNYPTRAGKLTLASLQTLERELDSMAARGNVENLIFIDDTFNVPLPRFKDICRLLIRKRYGFRWVSYFRCSNSDEEAIELMAESGCEGVFLGIESGSPSILTNMNKHATLEQYRRGIEWLHRRGILTFGSFICGFPGETSETVAETLDFIAGTGMDYYRIQMWYNEPGTPIQERRDEFSIGGDGFVWSHSTMDSQEAMEHIERAFLTLDGPVWLPQWSYDFWIIPYLFGKGLTREQFRDFSHEAQKLLALGVATVEPAERARLQEGSLERLTAGARSWRLR